MSVLLDKDVCVCVCVDLISTSAKSKRKLPSSITRRHQLRIIENIRSEDLIILSNTTFILSGEGSIEAAENLPAL